MFVYDTRFKIPKRNPHRIDLLYKLHRLMTIKFYYLIIRWHKKIIASISNQKSKPFINLTTMPLLSNIAMTFDEKNPTKYKFWQELKIADSSFH